MAQRNVGISIHEGVEVLDFCGPFEVFGVAGQHMTLRPFKVFTVAKTHDTVVANTGMQIVPDYSFEDCPPLDILLVPGGNSANMIEDEAIAEWVRGRADSTEYLLSVCTGALLYGRLGLLDGLESTTHYGFLDRLEEIAPRTTVRGNARWIDSGRVITSAGVSAGIDMALYVVGRLLGKEAAVETARYMEYEWKAEYIEMVPPG